MLFAALLPVVNEIIEKIFPDPAQAADAKLKLLQLQVSDKQFTASLEDKAAERLANLQQAQLEVNKIEASNANLFVSGWRPAIGWVCGLAFAFQFVISPLLMFILPLCDIHPIEFPKLDNTDLMTILGGLLGFGGFRTFEKIKGVAKK